jgi:hypothetical protein
MWLFHTAENLKNNELPIQAEKNLVSPKVSGSEKTLEVSFG